MRDVTTNRKVALALCRRVCLVPLATLALAVGGCTGDDHSSGGSHNDSNGAGGALVVPDTYTFASRFVTGASSVAYDGQVLRHVLIAGLKAHIGGLTARIDDGSFVPEAGDVVAELEFYYDFDPQTAGDVEHGITTNPAPLQKVYADIGAANLREKTAGNDSATDYKDWSREFVGWDDPSVTTPESLIRLWFQELEELAIARANGNAVTDPATGDAVSSVYVTADGRDLKELLQKFIDGAVTYSQGTDDYLDDATDGKGLLADNSTAEEGKPYTALEHQWDEGFGYFGAARDYGDYSDDEIAAAGGRPDYAGYHDSNGDGAIDLKAEINWGHSINAAKRDRGAAAEAPTDFTRDAWDALRTGRAIITQAAGPLTDGAMEALKAERDKAVRAWENAIAATVVHYINETLQDMNKFGTNDYSFTDHAKHWSELKGFALSLQFNPRKQLSDAEFAELHRLIGQAPVLPNAAQAEIEDYYQALLEARALMGEVYGFDAANLGDENGENGW